jgi:hypothetical protein
MAVGAVGGIGGGAIGGGATIWSMGRPLVFQ